MVDEASKKKKDGLHDRNTKKAKRRRINEEIGKVNRKAKKSTGGREGRNRQKAHT